ncbi:MAG: hypothetical protein U5J63_13515 [Fodinibius sp.]|nr:hypothetical protein [Fodinibius sp.]
MNTNKDRSFDDEEQQKGIMDVRDALFRESPLPEEGMEQGPWWLYAVIIVTFAFGFFYIGFSCEKVLLPTTCTISSPKPEQTEAVAVLEEF